MTKIDPYERFKNDLPSIEKPARYLGGEAGSIIKDECDFCIALCFPDLYEIGMSNNAMRILYASLNKIEGVACERVFAVAADYERLLIKSDTALYGLETGRALCNFDIMAFSIGYELAASNVLQVLNLGKIALEKKNRKAEAPLVIAGGPAVSNPVPYSAIMDAVWIGEAENAFFELIAKAKDTKKNGGSRNDILALFEQEKAFWMPGKKAYRHVYGGFSESPALEGLPVASVKPVQNHGIVEIMRGCPNSCRFCHATYNYRPRRLRSPEAIYRDVEQRVLEGKKEISLSSLSSGDYPDIVTLLELLKNEWASRGVSFQLPSLKIESFPLEAIEALASGVRKSGLTFAVETPLDAWQLAINKKASLDKIGNILQEASKKGYKLAKFYFMIGLPVTDKGSGAEFAEEEEIVKQIKNISSFVPGMHLNITLATFVPKPHTPFQWHSQLPVSRAREGIFYIKDNLRKLSNIKISYHNPELSWLEGLVARGDERVGELLLAAYNNGARFDAWDNLFDKNAWHKAVLQTGMDTESFFKPRDANEKPVWSSVKMGVSEAYLRKEFHKAGLRQLTGACRDDCNDMCGACNDKIKIENAVDLKSGFKRLSHAAIVPDNRDNAGNAKQDCRIRLVLRYNKEKSISLYAHHDLVSILSVAMERAEWPITYSEGFNPLPKMEISEPLPLGVESLDEYASVFLAAPTNNLQQMIRALNNTLYSNLTIKEALVFNIQKGQKSLSLSNIHWGSSYVLDFANNTSDLELFYEKTKTLIKKETLLYGSAIDLADNNKLNLTLKFTGKKHLGLQALFISAFGKSFREMHCHITREKQFAISDDRLYSYIELYKSLYKITAQVIANKNVKKNVKPGIL